MPRREMKFWRVEDRSMGECEERRRFGMDSVPSSQFVDNLRGRGWGSPGARLDS